jgi:hypothetical protein
MILDIPRGDLIESPSSYGLSIFSSKDVSHHDEGTGAAHEESSSVSIGDLWPKIDNLDEAGHEGTFAAAPQSHREDPASHPRPSFSGSRKRVREGADKALTEQAENAPLDEVSGPSSAPPRGYGGGSVRSKAAWILLDTPRAISPCMRRLFVDRQYSPSIGMDQSE